MTEILLRRDVTLLNPEDLVARNIRLLSLDVENMLTDCGDTKVRPEVAATVDELRTGVDGLTVVLCTNNKNKLLVGKDHGFVNEVASQLGTDIKIYYPSGDLRGKMWPDLFGQMSFDSGIPRKQIMHADDQLKNYWGARRAAIGSFVWTEPYGEHDHPVVRLFRPAEAKLRKLVAATQLARERIRSV